MKHSHKIAPVIAACLLSVGAGSAFAGNGNKGNKGNKGGNGGNGSNGAVNGAVNGVVSVPDHGSSILLAGLGLSALLLAHKKTTAGKA